MLGGFHPVALVRVRFVGLLPLHQGREAAETDPTSSHGRARGGEESETASGRDRSAQGARAKHGLAPPPRQSDPRDRMARPVKKATTHTKNRPSGSASRTGAPQTRSRHTAGGASDLGSGDSSGPQTWRGLETGLPPGSGGWERSGCLTERAGTDEPRVSRPGAGCLAFFKKRWCRLPLQVARASGGWEGASLAHL